ncbi:MAG: hypothetical protein NTW87_15415 [Planctomycetota bacterium]|nr:hypothetical protein [Planctomycetota bacterium]
MRTRKDACYAVLPLDDDLLDYLLERNPRFQAECERVFREMKAGRFKTHAEVKKLFGLA